MKANLFDLFPLFLLFITCHSIPLTGRDLVSQRQIGAFDLSSNNQLVYSVKVHDSSAKKGSNSLYFVDNENTFDHRNLTEPKLGTSDHSPKFTPDGEHVMFLSNRNKSSQIFIMRKNDDESQVQQLTNYPINVLSFKLSKNYIIFNAEIYLDCEDFQCTADKDKELDENPGKGTVYDSLFVRHWDTWKVPKRVSHVFLQRISKKGNSYQLDGNPIDLLGKMKADSPVPPFGGSEHYDLSPNETLAVFTAAPISHNTSWVTGWKTYTVSVSGSTIGIPMSITDYTDARTQNPIFSKSGKYIAYLAMDRAGNEADRLHIVIYDINAKTTTKLTNNLDNSFSNIFWGNDDHTIFGDLDLKGTHSLSVVRFSTGNVEFSVLVGNGTVSGAAISSSGKIVYAKSSFTATKNLFTFQWTNQTNISPRQITEENPSVVEKYNLKNPIPVLFNSKIDGVQVEGYLFRPYNFDPSKMYPLVLLIHGGPEQAWNNAWSYGWNPHIWVSAGYAVAQLNIRGSTGYGQNFTDAIKCEWGGLAYNDVMNGLDHILNQNSWIDKNRLAACGGSFGGYMINWIAGNTNRFSALVNHDGVFDTTDLYYSTEELWFPEWEFAGTPWEKSENYEKYNPVNFISNWQTPMLVIQGNRDYRISNSQSLGAFSALQRRGIKSKLLFFPEENHWVLAPENSVQWYKEILNFLDEHIPK